MTGDGRVEVLWFESWKGLTVLEWNGSGWGAIGTTAIGSPDWAGPGGFPGKSSAGWPRY